MGLWRTAIVICARYALLLRGDIRADTNFRSSRTLTTSAHLCICQVDQVCILSITPIKMASVSSPTSLASFSYQHAQSSRYPHVPLSPVHGTEGVAVAAVQGDGVWTYDVSAAVSLSSWSCMY